MKGGIMTTNELTYWRDKRANEVAQLTLGEQKRHNLATEKFTAAANQTAAAQVAETNRSNLANERLKAVQNTEINRSNLANEQLKRGDLGLNIQKHQEVNRSNLAQEALSSERNALQQQANAISLEIAYLQDAAKSEDRKLSQQQLMQRAREIGAKRYELVQNLKLEREKLTQMQNQFSLNQDFQYWAKRYDADLQKTLKDIDATMKGLELPAQYLKVIGQMGSSGTLYNY